MTPALEAPSCIHWTAREVPKIRALEWEEKQEREQAASKLLGAVARESQITPVLSESIPPILRGEVRCWRTLVHP